MTGLVRKSLDAPEETRLFQDGKGKLELVNPESGAVGRATFEPGWQWSKHVKPIAQPRAARPLTWATSSLRQDQGRHG
jgi:hypothetical protein